MPPYAPFPVKPTPNSHIQNPFLPMCQSVESFQKFLVHIQTPTSCQEDSPKLEEISPSINQDQEP